MTSWKTNIDMSHENQLGKVFPVEKHAPFLRDMLLVVFFWGVELQAATISIPKLSKPKDPTLDKTENCGRNFDDIIMEVWFRSFSLLLMRDL